MMTNLNVRTIKGCFPGSLPDALNDMSVIDHILSLTGRFDESQAALASTVNVVYVGTAVYDIPRYREEYTKNFIARGCGISEVCVAEARSTGATPCAAATMVTPDQLQHLAEAHIILLPEGNTLFAIRRWEETGLDACLRASAARGVVLVGGGCCFRAEHSDSANPKTCAQYMLSRENEVDSGQPVEMEEGGAKWEYLCVHGLSVLPGIFCPQHSSRDATGLLLNESFSKMLKRHPTERGIGVDCRAVLLLMGDGRYQVLTIANREGRTASVKDINIQIKDVVEGNVQTTTIQQQGSVEELLRKPCGPVVRDPFEAYYAMANPTALTEKLLCAPR
ncbi:serine peptidase family S51, peptidase E, putative [Trypanosoma equiperdum]|uniref:Serine peptidase family S51, peptidase E, putative n=1 Tax=Trypanosoma equiperdum TaxID=5694 RepID=A0A1G4IKS7_TRYEQ|nr:serine peptidase family S51, peptidase E, putative [Trypanosoma equiperdum]